MGSYKGQSSYSTLWSFCLVVGVVPGVVSIVELTSNPPTIQPICSGGTIEFTCITTGSSRLSWRSDEYIGAGTQLEFLSIDPIGTTRSSTDTIANLTAIDDDMLVLTSALRIITRSTLPSSTITCVSGGLGTINTSMVQVAAVPGAPRDLKASGSMEDCMVQVTWDPPADADISDYTYRVDIPSRNITASNNSSTESIVHVPNCADDILIRVYTMNQFGCLMSSEAQLRLLTGSTTSRLSISAIAGIVVGAAAFGIIVIILILVASIFFGYRKVKQQRQDHKEYFTRDLKYLIQAIRKVDPSLVLAYIYELLELMEKMPPRNIQDVLLTVLEKKLASARRMKKFFCQLKLFPEVISAINAKLCEDGSTVTVDNLIEAENHQELFEKLKTKVKEASPDVVQDNLKKLLEALRDASLGPDIPLPPGSNLSLVQEQDDSDDEEFPWDKYRRHRRNALIPAPIGQDEAIVLILKMKDEIQDIIDTLEKKVDESTTDELKGLLRDLIKQLQGHHINISQHTYDEPPNQAQDAGGESDEGPLLNQGPNSEQSGKQPKGSKKDEVSIPMDNLKKDQERGASSSEEVV